MVAKNNVSGSGRGGDGTSIPDTEGLLFLLTEELIPQKAWLSCDLTFFVFAFALLSSLPTSQLKSNLGSFSPKSPFMAPLPHSSPI